MSSYCSVESVVYLDSIGLIEWPEHHVVIADEGLPQDILSKLPDPILVPAGEQLKSLASVGELAERVLARRSSRPLVIVAVGGGSVGDAVGFLASTLWRGVDLWHIPTTLLAMVDSAHGGKTAVNLGFAKNQIGTFYPAEKILIISEILAELPMPQRREGLAELIKGLWLDDAAALDRYDEVARDLAHAPFAQIEAPMIELLRAAIEVKYRIVARDPHEKLGVRTFLNFGHTVAHALELEFKIPHGLAVGWGMMAAAKVSSEFELDPESARRLAQHVEPILEPITGMLQRLDFDRFDALLKRDKKTIDRALRSVLLRAPGDPVVTREVTSTQWFDALTEVYSEWLDRPRRIEWAAPRDTSIAIEASKSELNRALVIAALRPGETEVIGYSLADDVVRARVALAELSRASGEATVHVGLGGTTFRFLLAAAALRDAPTRLLAEPKLLSRPHGALFDALREAGAGVEEIDGGILVTPIASRDVISASVRVDESSQYVSAMAMLASGGARVELTLMTDAEGGFAREQVASARYFEMTLDLLRDAGVESTWDGARVVLTPRDVHGDATLEAHADASSAAVWSVARFLGAPVEVSNLSYPSRQADSVLPDLLAQIRSGGADEVVEIDLHGAPDLLPVLSAAAVFSPAAVRFTRVAHARIKESNRIDDLAAAYERVGIVVTTHEDGLEVAAGVQTPAEGRWPVFDDHRLAMTGALVAMYASIEVEEPWVVAKSYPRFWADYQLAGGVFGG